MNVIYYLQSGENGPIKIAATNHARLDRLIADCQALNPQPLLLRALYIGDATAESRQHARHASDRLHGDWFNPIVLDQPPSDLQAVPFDTADVDRRAALARMRARLARSAA
jgi:hypothetical protein